MELKLLKDVAFSKPVVFSDFPVMTSADIVIGSTDTIQFILICRNDKYRVIDSRNPAYVTVCEAVQSHLALMTPDTWFTVKNALSVEMKRVVASVRKVQTDIFEKTGKKPGSILYQYERFALSIGEYVCFIFSGETDPSLEHCKCVLNDLQKMSEEKIYEQLLRTVE